MYIVFCIQHIDDKRTAHPGPRGHTGVKPDPKGKGAGKTKGYVKDPKAPDPPKPHSEPRLAKLVVPGTIPARTKQISAQRVTIMAK